MVILSELIPESIRVWKIDVEYTKIRDARPILELGYKYILLDSKYTVDNPEICEKAYCRISVRELGKVIEMRA